MRHPRPRETAAPSATTPVARATAHGPDAEAVLACAAERLRRAADVAARTARARGRPILASATVTIPPVDPVSVFERSGSVARERMLWVHESDRFGLVGVGAAWTFTAEGPDRFRRADDAWQTVLDQASVHGPEAGAWGAGPIAMTGFAFAPEPPGPQWTGYPAALLVLPRLSLARTGDASRVTLAVMADPRHSRGRLENEVSACLDVCTAALTPGGVESGGGRSADLAVIGEFPPAAAWKASVLAAARTVRDGGLRKVVLSRGLRVRARRLDRGRTLRALRTGYPGCTLFAVARGAGCFLGATPERLLRVRGGVVHAPAIAGSAPRGRTEEEDRRLGEALRASAKERIEHAVVAAALRDALGALCSTVSAGTDPVLLKVQNVQHLCTPLTAKLGSRRTVLELADRLHPTPAVGGAPHAEALRWIAEHEGWDRGWYAGLVGWVNREGEGECAVAIRSALLRDAEARLFAGCGIVADSDPDQEYAESCLKLGAVLSALSGAGRDDA